MPRKILSIVRRAFVKFVIFLCFFFWIFEILNVRVSLRSFLNVLEKRFDLKVVVIWINVMLFDNFPADRQKKAAKEPVRFFTFKQFGATNKRT
jgi:hypothetical protein